MASRWIRDIWQPFRDRMEFAALVDPNPAARHEAGDWLGLPQAARFAGAREAFATIDADYCCIVTHRIITTRQSSWRVVAAWTSFRNSQLPTLRKCAAQSRGR